MAAGYGPKDCGLCPRVLDAHCRLHGQANQTFCDLFDRYKTDPAYGTDDVMADLMRIATPDQIKEVTAALATASGETGAGRSA